MSSSIDLFDLRLFILVAETRSLTRGADRACISLGAASTRVKNMEQSMGVRLLNRTAGGMVMTPAGEVVLGHARQIHSHMERLKCDLHEFRQGTRGRLCIHLDTSAFGEHLTDRLAEFLRQHPGVGIELKESLSDEAARAVAEGHAHIGVVAGDAPTSGLTTQRFGVSRLAVLVSSRSSLAHRSELSFTDVLRQPQVALHEGTVLHRFLSMQAEHAGHRFHPRVHVGSREEISRMVGKDVGVAVVPSSSSMPAVYSGDVYCIPLSDSWAQRELRLIMSGQSEQASLAQRLFRHLAAVEQPLPAPKAPAATARHATSRAREAAEQPIQADRAERSAARL